MGFFIEPSALPGGLGGFIQVVFLAAAYGYVLFAASNMISEGSELLLLVPSLAGIVGSVVLPVLGAVPDGAIVLFSGLGPDAQEQLSVGVGALAGSTIMLLTVPWALSIFAGRVNLDARGRGAYRRPLAASATWSKLNPPGRVSLTRTGVNVRPSVRVGGKWMLGTALAYALIQGPAFALDCAESSGDCHGAGERYWALAGLVYCVVAFVAYLVYQVRNSDNEAALERIDEARKTAIANSMLTLSGAFAGELAASVSAADSALLADGVAADRLRGTLRAFFHKYDRNGDGAIDKTELGSLLADLGEKVSPGALHDMMEQLDADQSGTIDFDEFSTAMTSLVRRHAAEEANKGPAYLPYAPALAAASVQGSSDVDGGAAGDDDDEEEEDIPEDLADLSPSEQQRRIKMRAAWMMAAGTALVLVFSDPMVDVLSDLGRRMDVAPFYVSFVLAPLASNASELLASYNYALKKTKKTITISMSALQGAAVMNNAFCLGIFLALIFFRGLVWEFSAETIAILAVQLALAFMSFKSTHRLLDAILVLALYPASLVLVAALENAGLN